MTDFLQPGRDGALELDVNEWVRGSVYTAKPGTASRLQPDQEYRITVAFKQKIAKCEAFAGFRHLYQRVTAIANARISQLKCAGEKEHFHSSILLHGWRSHDTYDIATAFLTMGLGLS